MELAVFLSVVFLVISVGQAETTPQLPGTTEDYYLGSTPGSEPSSPSSLPSSASTPMTWDNASYPESSSDISTVSPNTTEPNEQQGDNAEDVGIDEGDDGKADNLADYFVKKIGDLIKGSDDDDDGESEETGEDQEDIVDDPSLKNCSQEATLDRYCNAVPKEVHTYLNNDVSVQGMLRSIFNQSVVDAIQANCEPGNWCLPDEYHKDILQCEDNFYVTGPFCSDAMWTCLEKIVDLRYDCEEKPLSFLTDVILLLCDMRGVGDLSPECYARTVEALYVSYADSTRENSSHEADLEKDDCNDYKVHMTTMYLCADDVCGFDQNLLLQEFSAWADIADKAVGVAITCNISRECQNDYSDEDEYYDDDYYDDDDYFDEDEEEEDEDYEDYKEEMKEIEEEIQKELANEGASEEGTGTPGEFGSYYEDGEVNANTGDSYEDGDRAMLFGLITMTTVLTLGLLSLIFVAVKRYRRSRYANYRRGYSQLEEEEAKMLRNEYK